MLPSNTNYSTCGPCLFNALSDQLYGDQSHHVELSGATVDYIRSKPDHFKQFITVFPGGGIRHVGARATYDHTIDMASNGVTRQALKAKNKFVNAHVCDQCFGIQHFGDPDLVASRSCKTILGDRALQDYQMQLMLLEQQSKKRLLMARQEHNAIGGGLPDGMAIGLPGQNAPISPSKVIGKL